MKKINSCGALLYERFCKHNLKMKLTTILMIVSLFQIQANTYSQNAKVTLNLENVTVEEVFSEIEAQSKFRFLYNHEKVDVNKKVSVKVEKMAISDVLESIFKNTDIYFLVKRKQIILKTGKIKDPVPAPIEEIQELTVTGTITDADGVPMPGANILEKGTTNGTQTDFDGNFSMTIADANATLVVSYIGFATQEVAVNGRETIAIQMQTDASSLEEVVVVGYGTQRRKDVTGAIASVKSESFNKGVVANAGQLLQGKVSGVNVSSSSGEPGASQDIIIRGVGSLRSGTTPLYVVDGFPIDNSGNGMATNPLNFINPQDIASIDVLKDASAAAIYGARAANGVIVITTKKGRSGQTQMNLSVSTAFSTLSNKVDVFSASEFRSQVVAAGGILTDGSANTDWQDELTQTAISKNVNFSMSGGTDNSSYATSLGVDDQEGIFRNSHLKRYSGRLNLTQRALDDKFKVEFNLTGSKIDNTRPDANGIVNRMLGMNPTDPVRSMVNSQLF